MVANFPDIFYPTEDDEPLAETREHLLAIFAIFDVLSRFLFSKAIVFSDQFLYYKEGVPDARVAPDVMVVFGLPDREYGNYKIWEFGIVPSVIFEVTSESTKKKDWELKKRLYQSLGVEEYWLFDPYGDWITGQLVGYFLNENGTYYKTTSAYSRVLGLQLQVRGYLLEFYRSGQKLPTSAELEAIVETERQRAELERQQAELERQRAEQEQKRAESERQRAEQERQQAELERQRAEQEQKRAESAELRADRLAAKLRELGIDL